MVLTLLELQSRFGDNWGQVTWSVSALSPKQDWSSKGVNHPTLSSRRGQPSPSDFFAPVLKKILPGSLQVYTAELLSTNR